VVIDAPGPPNGLNMCYVYCDVMLRRSCHIGNYTKSLSPAAQKNWVSEEPDV
jgi:hypothetical protein